jgi:hypothetical protein
VLTEPVEIRERQRQAPGRRPGAQAHAWVWRSRPVSHPRHWYSTLAYPMRTWTGYRVDTLPGRPARTPCPD